MILDTLYFDNAGILSDDVLSSCSDTQHHDVQQNDAQHYRLECDPQNQHQGSLLMLSVIMLHFKLC